jgi:hypothetical protein
VWVGFVTDEQPHRWCKNVLETGGQLSETTPQERGKSVMDAFLSVL